MATLVRWEPFRELATLQTELSRVMNGLSEGDGRSTQSWVPPVDVWETEDELVYAFDLPGIPQDRISIDLHDDTLTVSASASSRASDPTTGSTASNGATAASAGLSASRRGSRRTPSRPTTGMACSRSESPSPRSRSRAGSRSAARMPRLSRRRSRGRQPPRSEATAGVPETARRHVPDLRRGGPR